MVDGYALRLPQIETISEVSSSGRVSRSGIWSELVLLVDMINQILKVTT